MCALGVEEAAVHDIRAVCVFAYSVICSEVYLWSRMGQDILGSEGM